MDVLRKRMALLRRKSCYSEDNEELISDEGKLTTLSRPGQTSREFEDKT